VLLTQAAQARIVSRIARITCHQPSRQIYLDDVPLELTTKEYEIMARLVQSAGTIVERERLISEVFDRELRRENRALDMHISNLRRKLGQHGFLIVTVRGIGYSLRVPESGKW
jgi:DNA-binding response OmpR family regulator